MPEILLSSKEISVIERLAEIAEKVKIIRNRVVTNSSLCLKLVCLQLVCLLEVYDQALF